MMSAPGEIEPRNVLLRDLGPLRPAALGFALDDFHAGVELVGHDVPVMQKRVFLEANVHERGLEPVFEVAHLALEDAADEAFLGRALDVEFLQLAILGHRDAGFERLGVDDDFLVDFLFRADEPLNFFDDVRRGVLDGFEQALGRLGDFHRLEFLLRHRGRRGPSGAGALTGCGRGRRRHALGRQAGGEVFRPFNFMPMPFLKQAIRTALFADHVSPGLDRLAVGFLLSGVQAAFGLEPHSAAAPREVVIAHSQYPLRFLYTFCIRPSAINEHNTEDPP